MAIGSNRKTSRQKRVKRDYLKSAPPANNLHINRLGLGNKTPTTNTPGKATKNKLIFFKKFRKSKHQKSKSKFLLLRVLLILVVIGLVFLIALFLWFAKDLPSPNKLNGLDSAQTSRLYDRTGNTVLYEIYSDENRTLVDFKDMPKCIKDATVAIEDKDFYKHGAFSIAGIVRAFYYTIFKRSTQGGSTITQQYIKNAVLTNEVRLSRKIKELILAIEMEQVYKKDDILKLYLNEIPYGATAYGINSASRTFFNKSQMDLTLDECALLAALPQRPSYYSPYGEHTEQLVDRKNIVLQKMLEQGMISSEDAKRAQEVDTLAKISLQSNTSKTAPHFVEYVQSLLEEKYGVNTVTRGGLKIITTLDLNLQSYAETAINDNYANVLASGGSNAALVSANPRTGEVLSMVGSYDYNNPDFGGFNVATGYRQPGSSFKPLVYSALLRGNYGAGSIFYDLQTDFGGNYIPQNYSRKFYGAQSLRKVLASSLNIPAVKGFYMANPASAVDFINSLGLTNLSSNNAEDSYLPTALGGREVRLIDMVNAYSVLANEGKKSEQTYILKITDPSGKTLEEFRPESKQVLDPQISYILSDILSDNNARTSLGVFAVNNPLTLPDRKVAAKTGTTNDYKDAWTMGYTPELVTGVWSGNNDGSVMTVSASIVSAPIWNSYMRKALADKSKDWYTEPNGIQKLKLNALTGKKPAEGDSNVIEDIFPSWYKLEEDKNLAEVTIDKVSGQKATACTPDEAKSIIRAGKIMAEIPSSDPAFARWDAPVQAYGASLGLGGGGTIPVGVDSLHQCDDAKPSITISANSNLGNVVPVSVEVLGGTHALDHVDILVDGTIAGQISITTSGNYQTNLNISDAGTHNIQARVWDSALYHGDSGVISVTTSTGGPSGTINCANNNCSVIPSANNGGTITSVELFVNNSSVGIDSSAPYSWTGIYSAGDSVYAIIIDSSGVQAQVNL